MSNAIDATTRYAYATLLTRPSYLAGAILLAYTLHKHSPSTPLVILYTPETFPEASIRALESESLHTNTIPYAIEHLRLPEAMVTGSNLTSGMVAERFIDTWTKLRVFQLQDLASEHGWEKICFLDADMMIFKNPTHTIFTPALDEIELLASHVCVCNLDSDPWAPKDWKKENCAYTPLSKDEDNEVPPAAVKDGDPTLGIMNTGTFAFRPTKSISEFVMKAFMSMPLDKLRGYKFPDQDFLNDVFEGKWKSLKWSVNALKTWRYWHENIWTDSRVEVLHYIVDKPWARRLGEDGRAGYRGEDGVTHSWWWDEYGRWLKERKEAGEDEMLSVVGCFVAGIDRDGEDLEAVGGKAQDFAKKWETDETEAASHVKVPRRPLGEHGKGPLNRPRPGLEANAHEPRLQPQGVETSVGPGPNVGQRGHASVVRGGFSGKRTRGSSYMADG